MLLLIYGLTLGSVGLLSLSLVPEAQQRIDAYLASVRRSKEELEDLFIMVPRQRLMAFYIVAPTLLTIIGWLLWPNPLVLPMGVVVGLLLPRLFVKFAEIKRRHRFQTQLVDSLMVMSASLKAGMSILQSLEVLAEESAAPMAEEIALALKEVRMGLSMDESLHRLHKRMPLDELNLIITAILVARETGGDITSVFSKLIETIRERQKLKERVKTLTVIPRLQGWIMACIPIVFGMFVTGINKEYFEKFFSDPLGQLIAAIAVGAWLISLVLIVWFSRSPL
jgi:tight adherence protein B